MKFRSIVPLLVAAGALVLGAPFDVAVAGTFESGSPSSVGFRPSLSTFESGSPSSVGFRPSLSSFSDGSPSSVGFRPGLGVGGGSPSSGSLRARDTKPVSSPRVDQSGHRAFRIRR